ncbi:hypothetical protein AGMMS49959_04850 [Planctomycetales bacterium]|nr:hypothetical protein AGMMS49959_04850 [Planctomycetales bacterium]
MLALFRLLRLPATVVALADILAGCWLLRFAGLGGDLARLPALLLAGAALFLAATAWRDWFGYARDKILNPRQPLPAGEISLTTAYLLGAGLTVAGLMLAMTAGYAAFYLAAALALLLLAEAVAFRSAEIIAPLTRGAIRAGAVVFGMSVHAGLPWLAAEPTVWLPPLLVGIYAALTTTLARWARREIMEIPVVDRAVDTPTEMDELVPPLTGTEQSEWQRRRELWTLTRQNHADHFRRAPHNYLLSVRGAKFTLVALFLTPLAAALILPRPLPVLLGVLALWLWLSRPARDWWIKPDYATLPRLVKRALSGACIFNAFVVAGFCGNFWGGEWRVCAVIALLAAPALGLNRQKAIAN